jgi:hypothetical protein
LGVRHGSLLGGRVGVSQHAVMAPEEHHATT